MSERDARFPGDCSIAKLDKLHSIAQQLTQSANTNVTVSLANVRKFTPFTACFLLSLIHDLKARGKIVTVVVPTNKSAFHQYEYMGIGLHFGRDVTSQSSSVPTMRLRHIRTENYEVAFDMAKILESEPNITKDHVYLAKLCLKEVFQNAFQHARSETGVYACAHSDRARHMVRLCVMDKGVGIFRHLRSNPKYENVSDDLAAIRLVIQKGVSGVPQSFRGLGLYYLTKLLEDIGGELVMASGHGLFILRPPAPPVERELAASFKGTIVGVTFELKPPYRFLLDNLEL